MSVGSPYLGNYTAQQPQEQRYPFLSESAVFPCDQTKVWLPALGFFNVRADDFCCCLVFDKQVSNVLS